MNAKSIALIGAAVLVVVLALWLLPERAAVEWPGADASAGAAPPAERGRDRQERLSPAVAAAQSVGSDGVDAVQAHSPAADGAETGGEPAAAPAEGASAADRRDKQLERWDALVDRVAATDEVTLELGVELRNALNGVDPQDRLPAIHSALNLVPDGGFAVFVPLLFDKGQPEEILDAIFNDMLNRDESVKEPLMKELRKDKSHPMFFESARILDATGVE